MSNLVLVCVCWCGYDVSRTFTVTVSVFRRISDETVALPDRAPWHWEVRQ